LLEISSKAVSRSAVPLAKLSFAANRQAIAIDQRTNSPCGLPVESKETQTSGRDLWLAEDGWFDA